MKEGGPVWFKLKFHLKYRELMITEVMYFKFSPKDIFSIAFRKRGRERGKGREENIRMRERHQLVASCRYPDLESHLDSGSNLYVRYLH